MNSTLFFSPMVTRSPGCTPAFSSPRAMRLVRRSSSAQVTVRVSSVIAGRSGRSAASSKSRAPNETTSFIDWCVPNFGQIASMQ